VPVLCRWPSASAKFIQFSGTPKTALRVFFRLRTGAPISHQSFPACVHFRLFDFFLSRFHRGARCPPSMFSASFNSPKQSFLSRISAGVFLALSASAVIWKSPLKQRSPPDMSARVGSTDDPGNPSLFVNAALEAFMSKGWGARHS
jgi:hypothetical protein